MHILALETSGPRCSAALAGAQGLIAVRKSPGGRNHLQHLMPLVRALLDECQLQISDITAIAVSAGPGSFTGIRIGVATARALAQALGCPVIPVDSLRAFAWRTPDPMAEAFVCPVFDARRNQVYAGAYLRRDGRVREVVPGGAYLLEEYLDLLARGIREGGLETSVAPVFYGDGLGPCGAAIEQWSADNAPGAAFRREEDGVQEAGAVARLGLDMWLQEGGRDYREVLPNYMRKAEAQRRLEEGAINPGAKALVAKPACCGGNEFAIRGARKGDIDPMTRLDALCFAAPWSRKSFEAELTGNPLARYLVAETPAEGEPMMAGYAGLWAIGGEGHITNVAVHPDFRRKGMGRALVGRLIEKTRQEGLTDYTLEVRAGNLAAIRLYEGFGFREAGIRPGYYEDNNEDAILMWLHLGGTPGTEGP